MAKDASPELDLMRAMSYEIKEDAQEVLFEATLFDLINAFSQTLSQCVPKRRLSGVTGRIYC